MKTLKLSVQLVAGCLVILIVPFLLFSVCGVQVPRIAATLARCAGCLIPVVVVFLLIYCSAVGVGGFRAGWRSQSWAKSIKSLVFLVIVGFILASLIRVLWSK
jgi:hypothetical protein